MVAQVLMTILVVKDEAQGLSLLDAFLADRSPLTSR